MIGRVLLLAAALAAGAALPAAAQTVTPHTIPTANSAPGGIAAGPDGALWFTETNGNKIGRITTAGAFSEFALPTANAGPGRITAGPDGALWFMEVTANKIGRITTAGKVTEFVLPQTENATIALTPGIAAGPDGALWFVAIDGANIGRITTSGTVTEFPIASRISEAGPLTLGPDGNLWFVAAGGVGKITTSGTVTTFSEFSTNPVVDGIAAGSDGNLWFSEGPTGNIGRVTTSGTITEFPIPNTINEFDSMVAGPDGALWFVENTGGVDRIWRLTTSGGTSVTALTASAGTVPAMAVGKDGAIWLVQSAANQVIRILPGSGSGSVALQAAVLPASRSVQVGATATVFATVINGGTTSGTSCGIAPVTSVPATFRYQTTNASNNGLTGSPNTPVTIPAGKSQSFLLSFATTAAFAPTQVSLGFTCSNGSPAPTDPGIDTLLLSASTQAVPDIIVLAATASGNGILDIPGTGGTGAFAIATDDAGSGGTLTVDADTNGTSLPLALSICQTDPSSGACKAAPSSSVNVAYGSNATPTFAIFAKASGSIALSPAVNRVFVTFKDSTGAIRGQTSVAVQTQ